MPKKKRETYKRRMELGRVYLSRETRGESMTEAKCPICGIVHKIWMNWQGRGVPRKYCKVCLQRDAVQAPPEYYRLGIF